MSLAAGTRLGVFEVLAPIGAGGMGEVYRARDTKLDREVALKLLPPHLAGRPERLARFEREAKLLAALDHPHIAAIHGLHEDGGQQFLVMELVEGETLAERLERGALPVPEALEMARQMAEALEIAHKKGIIHRDLKPSNIMRTEEARVKLLDFGLGKALAPDTLESSLDTATTPEDATAEGVVMGTAPFMSPEQARGDEVDERTDVWAFATVLFEMLTGKRAFPGRSSADAIAAVMTTEPDWDALPGETPPQVRSLLGRCLQKDRSRRLHDVADARIELEEALRIGVGSSTGVGGRSLPAAVWPRLASAIAGIGLVAIGGVLFWMSRSEPSGEVSKEQDMIVVLPFENLGAPDDAFFAAGMTDEITSRLAAVAGLGVISRTTATQYDRTGKTLKQLGDDLGVDYVLEGSVRWAQTPDGASRIRVTPQLIRVSDDTHVWTDRYDRTLDEVFAVQSAIAASVVGKLGVTLGQTERAVLDSVPTTNMDAYQAYLRGLAHASHPDYRKESFELAIAMFERAVELDPDFVEAHARLSNAHSAMYWYRYDRTEPRAEMAREAVDRAIAADPDSVVGRRALGLYHYHVKYDLESALAELRIAAAESPNDPEIADIIASVLRRQGDFDEALARFEQALRLSPRDARVWWETGGTYGYLRQYEKAHRYLKRSISLAPDQWQAYYHRLVLLRWTGALEERRAVLDSVPDKTNERYLEEVWWQHVGERDYETALGGLESRQPPLFGEDRDWYECYLRMLMNQASEARRPSCEAARVVAKKGGEERPGYYVPHIDLAVAYAGLDRDHEAIAEARLAIEASPLSRDAYMFGFWPEYYLAVVYILLDEQEAALDQIERLLSLPGGVSVQMLRVWVDFDRLRDHPRFQELIAASDDV